jgi:hypothetical protein
LKISIPAVKHIENTLQGPVIAILNFEETVESSLSKLSVARNAYIFRRQSFEVLILEHRDEKFSKTYEYVLYSNTAEFDLKSLFCRQQAY